MLWILIMNTCIVCKWRLHMKYCYNLMTVIGQYGNFSDSNEKEWNTIQNFAYANSSREIKEEENHKIIYFVVTYIASKFLNLNWIERLKSNIINSIEKCAHIGNRFDEWNNSWAAMDLVFRFENRRCVARAIEIISFVLSMILCRTKKE